MNKRISAICTMQIAQSCDGNEDIIEAINEGWELYGNPFWDVEREIACISLVKYGNSDSSRRSHE